MPFKIFFDQPIYPSQGDAISPSTPPECNNAASGDNYFIGLVNEIFRLDAINVDNAFNKSNSKVTQSKITLSFSGKVSIKDVGYQRLQGWVCNPYPNSSPNSRSFVIYHYCMNGSSVAVLRRYCATECIIENYDESYDSNEMMVVNFSVAVYTGRAFLGKLFKMRMFNNDSGSGKWGM